MDIINMKQKVSAVIFLIFLAWPGSGLFGNDLPFTPHVLYRVRGNISVHERRPQNIMGININLLRADGMPVNNARVLVNDLLAPHYSPGDYSNGAPISAITPGMRFKLVISIDGKVVVTGSATLAAIIKFIKPRTDELINRRLTPLILVEWIFSSGSWPVDLKVRKLPEKTTTYFQEKTRPNQWQVPVSGFPPACEADIILHTNYADLLLEGDVAAGSLVKMGYSTAQYVRTTN